MSEPINPSNLPFEGPTDPISQLTNGNPGAVNPGPVNAPGGHVSANPGPIQNPSNFAGVNPGPVQMKWRTPGTDPTSGLEKIVTPGTDPLSQVALNPQPLPPTNLTPSAIGGNGAGSGSLNRGVRNTIIVVCIIGVLLIGGGFVLQSALPGTGGFTVTFQPGVVQRQRQIQVSSTAKEHMTTSGSAQCATGSSLGALEERLVGGGFTADDDHGSVLNSESSYPKGNNDNWFADFAPQKQGHYATVIAICLREPASFFSSLQSFDTVQSSPSQAAADDKHPPAAVAVAACPSGEAILGGGYSSGLFGSGVYSIDASYPVDANGIGEWKVAFHVTGLQRVQLTAYAICSNGLTTHLEHKAIAGIGTRKNPYTQDSMTCASGTLLTGGYQITAPPSLVGVGDNSPLDDKTRTPASGDFVQHWYLEAESSGWQAKVSPGELWVTCLDTPISATPGATASAASTSILARPTNTPIVTRPTSTPRPRATATPTPTCRSIVSGNGTMNVDNSYLNVDIAAGIGHTLTGTQAHWDPASGTLVSVNGAAFSDKGTIGSSGYSGLTCTQLKSTSYTAHSVPVTSGEVFLVKTPGGHLAKVLITLTPGNPSPTLTWQTYQP